MADCDRKAVTGASITIGSADAETGGGYSERGQPSASAAVTSQDGLGVFYNIPPGRTDVVVELPGAEPTVVATEPILVRAGVHTQIIIPPPITFP